MYKSTFTFDFNYVYVSALVCNRMCKYMGACIHMKKKDNPSYENNLLPLMTFQTLCQLIY